MSKYVSVSTSDGYSFSHDFSSSDWDRLCSLCGRESDRVDLSEGSASIDGGTVFITLGSRTYDISASDLF